MSWLHGYSQGSGSIAFKTGDHWPPKKTALQSLEPVFLYSLPKFTAGQFQIISSWLGKWLPDICYLHLCPWQKMFLLILLSIWGKGIEWSLDKRKQTSQNEGGNFASAALDRISNITSSACPIYFHWSTVRIPQWVVKTFEMWNMVHDV